MAERGPVPLAAALSLLLLVGLAACGPDADPAAGPPAAGGSGPGPTCALAPSTVVSSALGIPIGEPVQTVNKTVTLCAYPSAGSGSVTVRFETGESAAGFAVARAGFTNSGQPTVDVPGLFDEAFSSTLGRGDIAVNTVVARHGSVDILITSGASVDRERALITTLFGSLG